MTHLQQWLGGQAGWWVEYRVHVHRSAPAAWLDALGDAIFGSVPFEVSAADPVGDEAYADRVSVWGSDLSDRTRPHQDTGHPELTVLPVLKLQGAPALFPSLDACLALGLKNFFPSPRVTLPQAGAWIGHTAAGPERAQVRLPGDMLLRHVLATGNSGAGKTTTLLRIGQQLMADTDVRRSVVLITPHAADFERFLRLVPMSRLDDLVVVDASDENYTASLNPLFGMNASQQAAHHLASRLCGLLDARFETRDSRGPAKQAHLRHTALLAGSHPARPGTLLDMVRILEDSKFRDRLMRQCPDESVSGYWRRFVATSGDHGYANWVPYLQAPLVPLTSHPVLKRLLCRPGRTVDVQRCIDDGKILAVNLSRGTLQEAECSALGAVLLTMLLDAAMSRRPASGADPTPCHVICDEFQSFAGDGMARLFAESRKFGLGWCVGMQQTSQLANRWGRDALMDAVLTNTATKILFRQGAGDLAALAPLVAEGMSPSTLGRLPDHHAVVLTPLPGVPTVPIVMEAMPPEPEEDPRHHELLAQRRRHGHDTVQRANEELKTCFSLVDADLA